MLPDGRGYTFDPAHNRWEMFHWGYFSGEPGVASHVATVPESEVPEEVRLADRLDAASR